MAQKMDLYQALGVEKTASKQDIEDMIDTLRLKLHPDRIKNDPDRAAKEERYKLLSDAKEILLNDAKRAAYDRGGYAAVDRMSGSSSGPSYSVPGPDTSNLPPADLSMTGLARFAKDVRKMDGGSTPHVSRPVNPSPSSTPAPATGGDDFASRMAAKRRQVRDGSAAPTPVTPAAPEKVAAPTPVSVPREIAEAQSANDRARAALAYAGSLPLDVLGEFQQNLRDTLGIVERKIAAAKPSSGPKP